MDMSAPPPPERPPKRARVLKPAKTCEPCRKSHSVCNFFSPCLRCERLKIDCVRAEDPAPGPAPSSASRKPRVSQESIIEQQRSLIECQKAMITHLLVLSEVPPPRYAAPPPPAFPMGPSLASLSKHPSLMPPQPPFSYPQPLPQQQSRSTGRLDTQIPYRAKDRNKPISDSLGLTFAHKSAGRVCMTHFQSVTTRYVFSRYDPLSDMLLECAPGQVHVPLKDFNWSMLRISQVSPRMCSAFGYNERDLLGKSFFDLFPSEIREVLEKNFAECKHHVPALLEKTKSGDLGSVLPHHEDPGLYVLTALKKVCVLLAGPNFVSSNPSTVAKEEPEEAGAKGGGNMPTCLAVDILRQIHFDVKYCRPRYVFFRLMNMPIECEVLVPKLSVVYLKDVVEETPPVASASKLRQSGGAVDDILLQGFVGGEDYPFPDYEFFAF